MMLKLSSLGKWIEERLNNTLAEHINNNSNTILNTDRVIYAFKVYTDQGNHKGYDYLNTNTLDIEGVGIVQLATNKRVRYIECQLAQNDSTVEATGYVSITRDTVLEIIIPLDNIDEVGFEETITEEIRTVLDNSFNTIGDAYVVENNNAIPFGFKYSLSNTGIRTNRAFIGDSISMTAYINFFFVESGISANDIEIYIDGERIIPLRYGFNRGTTQQSNTFSSDNTMTAKNTPTSSLFSFNFDTTMRNDVPLMDALEWKFKGTNVGARNASDYNSGTLPDLPNVAHLVKFSLTRTVPLPNGIGKDEIEGFTFEKYMIFENVALSGAIPLLASLSVTMTEVKVVEGLTPLTPRAYAKYYNI